MQLGEQYLAAFIRTRIQQVSVNMLAPALRAQLLPAAVVTLASLVAIATATATNVTLPRVEPSLSAGQRSLLGDLVGAVRDAAWPGDGGGLVTDHGRRLMEAAPEDLSRGGLTVAAVTLDLLRLAGNASAGAAISQPMSPLDACLVWRRRASAGAVDSSRGGSYFLTLFHSSVWSVLLLCLICSVAFLTLLESAHPIGMPRALAEARRKARGHYGAPGKAMGPFHVLVFAAGALLLMGYPRGPKGTAGRTLALFWWLFAFSVAAAYLAGTVLTFLTTRSSPTDGSAAPDASLAEVVPRTAGRVVLCSAGSSLCAGWAKLEPLIRANFSPVAGDEAGLQQLLLPGNANQLLLTHQFACANLLVADTNRTYSMGLVAKATAWVSLVGPPDLVNQANVQILNLLSSEQLARLGRQHGLAQMETYGGNCGGGGSGGFNDWLAELRLALPYRIGSFYGPLVLLLVGICLAICIAVCEFFYYRFFIDVEEEILDAEAEELERKERGLTVASTMDTYL